MADNNTAQERTEAPTAKRLQDARKKGQIARSRELGTSAVLIASAIGLLLIGPNLAQSLLNIMGELFTPSRTEIYDPKFMLNLWQIIRDELMVILIFIGFLFLASFAGNIALGGMNFSWQAIAPKLNRMSPLNGFKRMLGIQALIELLKAIAKFSVVAVTACLLLYFYHDELLNLAQSDQIQSIAIALELLVWLFILLCSSTLLIVIIDAPFQLWNHNKQLLMTKQEVKDELKDTEGRPEVKGRIKQIQKEIAQQRMMTKIPEADVIIVNPEHYAVAIKYDPTQSSAPYVVAKGVDNIAFKIREIANIYQITTVSSPALARAIYHTTKLEQQIPDGLFVAVAQVLAYVYQLKQYQQGRGRKPTPLAPEQPIPDELRY